MLALDNDGRIYATPHWRDGRYLYLLYPSSATQVRVRKYIGADATKTAEALRKVKNAETYDRLERETQRLEGSLMMMERQIAEMCRDLERFGPVDLVTQAALDGDTEGAPGAELVTNAIDSRMVTGCAPGATAVSPIRT